MGEVEGYNSISKSTTLCGGSLVSSIGKHPHNRTLLVVDPSLVSPRLLG